MKLFIKACTDTWSTIVPVKEIPGDEIVFLPYALQMLDATEFFMRLFNLESSVGPVKRWR